LNSPAGNGPEASIGELFGRLADDGRAFVKAEADLYKTIALRRVGKAQSGLIALVVAALLANAALIALLTAAVMALAPMVGPLLGGLIVAAASCLVAFLLVRFGAARMKALGGDAEERAALAAGEKAP
jgi:hypothetical protein